MHPSLSFTLPLFTPTGVSPEFLNAFFDAVRWDFFSRMREERKEEGFSHRHSAIVMGDGGQTMSPRSIRQWHKCIPLLRDSERILFHLIDFI